jgi:hypothetical protein
MSLTKASRQYLGVLAVAPPTLQVANRAPTSGDKAYRKGTLWLDVTDVTAFMWQGTSWIALGTGATGGVVTLTGDSGGAISPSGGNITLAGTANQIHTVGSGSTITFSLPSAVTMPGSLTVTTSLTATGGAVTGAATTVIGTGGTGAVQIGNATGNTAVTGSLTASTTLTATLGAITATNGNLVLGTAGNKIVSTSVASSTTAGANSFGKVTLVGGTATVATTAVTANSIIFLTRMSVGSTGANPLGLLSIGTITASTSFVINAWSSTDATALATTDVSSIGWMIVN